MINLPLGSRHVFFLRFQITRAEIEQGRHKRALRWLNELISDREIAWANREKLVLEVLGYDEDPRELWEIPEVRRFLRALHREWKYWFFFATHAAPTLSVLELCLTNAERFAPGVMEVDAEGSAHFYQECTQALLDIFMRFRFPPDEMQRILEGIQRLHAEREAPGST